MSMADDLYNKDQSGQMQQELLQKMTSKQIEDLPGIADTPSYLIVIFNILL